jgi:tetratricopeptide (TPR) repeat protein
MTPVDLLIIGENRSITKRIFVQNQEQTFEFILPIKPIRVELDPQYLILRWVPRLRLLAHARTAERFLSLDKDLNNAEREAQLLLQLDPLNATGWNSVALFTLGSIAVLRSDLLLAEEYFRKSSTLSFVEPAQTYPLMSMVRLGNVLEMQDKREQALQLYQLVISAAEQNPAVQSRPLDEARHFLRTPFISYEDLWLMR